MESNLDDEKFIKRLNQIKEEDPDRFMDMVLNILRKDESFAFMDKAPLAQKQTALSKMITRYEELQRYEDCAFLNGIKKRLV
jgi:hypothetical protein